MQPNYHQDPYNNQGQFHPAPMGNQGQPAPYGNPYMVLLGQNQNPNLNQEQPQNAGNIPFYRANSNPNNPNPPYQPDLPVDYNQLYQYNLYNQPLGQTPGPLGMTNEQAVSITTDAQGHQNAAHFQTIHVGDPAPIFGRNSIKIKCPYCKKEGMTKVKRTTDGTMICLILLFSLCIICCLFLLLGDEKYKYEHSCSNCNSLIGSSDTHRVQNSQSKKHNSP